jgi:hypothetical protein
MNTGLTTCGAEQKNGIPRKVERKQVQIASQWQMFRGFCLAVSEPRSGGSIANRPPS